MGEQVFPCNGRSSLSHRSDVRADEGDPTGPPDHSAVCDDADAAAGEAGHVDLLAMRADEFDLRDAEGQVGLPRFRRHSG